MVKASTEKSQVVQLSLEDGVWRNVIECMCPGEGDFSVFSSQGHMHIRGVLRALLISLGTHIYLMQLLSVEHLWLCHHFSDQGVCLVPCSEPATSAPNSQPMLDVGVVNIYQFSCPLVGLTLRCVLGCLPEFLRGWIPFGPSFLSLYYVCLHFWCMQSTGTLFLISRSASGTMWPKIPGIGFFYFKTFMWFSAYRTWVIVPCRSRSESMYCHLSALRP